MGKHKFYISDWRIQLKHENEIIYDVVTRNALVDQGEKLILDVFFRSNNVPVDFFIGLAYGPMSEASTLDNVPNEPVGNGYDRVALSRDTVGFPTMEMDSGDWVVITKSMTITADGGSIGPVNQAFMGANLASDMKYLISYVSLPTETVLSDGDDLTFSLKIKAM